VRNNRAAANSCNSVAWQRLPLGWRHGDRISAETIGRARNHAFLGFRE
jgi:hypothetical protein